MKSIKTLAIVFLLFFFLPGKMIFSQIIADTIITKQNKLIIGKVTKITDTDIEYKKDIEPDAIIYSIVKTKVREIRLGNGKVEFIMPDEMEMNHEAEIIDKRQVIKFNFFSPLYSHIAVTYEKSIKMGVNLEASLGHINNSMFDFGVNNNANLTQGITVSFGPKYILGNSYYIKGMKYSHPLKGAFVKPEIILTYFNVNNITYRNYNYYVYPYQTSYYHSDLRVSNVSFLINFGNQYILGNALTFGFKFGAGYAITSTRFTNSDFRNAVPHYDDYANNYTTFLYNQVKFNGNFTLVLTSSITLGYIFK